MLLITDRTDAMIGMRLAGVETALARDKASAEAAFEKASGADDIAILLVTSGIEKMCRETVNRIRQAGKPLISTIPDSDKPSGTGSAITDYIANAIGIKLD